MSELITLDVGGVEPKYKVYKETLLKFPDTFLGAMFKGHMKNGTAQPDGSYFIDQNHDRFQYILDFYRTGVFPEPYFKTQWESDCFQAELEYYGIIKKSEPKKEKKRKFEQIQDLSITRAKVVMVAIDKLEKLMLLYQSTDHWTGVVANAKEVFTWTFLQGHKHIAIDNQPIDLYAAMKGLEKEEHMKLLKKAIKDKFGLRLFAWKRYGVFHPDDYRWPATLSPREDWKKIWYWKLEFSRLTKEDDQ